ncbi:MAG: Arc family DNA-binding protein [Actinomycetota bacterium]
MTDETQAFRLRMPQDLYDAVKGAAFYTDRSMNGLIVAAIREYLAEQVRSKHFEAMLDQGETRYRAVLDKLAEL